MSLRFTFEDRLTGYLTAVSPSAPSGLKIQAGHKISDLELPALIIHADSAEAIDEGLQGNTRKISIQATVMTPVQESATVTSHANNFLWAEARLKDRAAMISGITAGITILGSHIQAERTETNERAMADSLSVIFYVDPA